VGPELETARLILRRWRPEDREPFAALNADPEVMEYFPAPLGRAESDVLVARIEADLERRGFGLWAVELRESAEFVGFVGLDVPQIEAHFMPAVEVGWRLARSAWGNGYATEAARATLAFGFERLGLEEIVAMTVVDNRRSRVVMERLGMGRDPGDDFGHPKVPVGDPLRPHVLYRIAAPEQGRRRPA
jgi:RimJ/RimL family protein N-acetyltransferase